MFSIVFFCINFIAYMTQCSLGYAIPKPRLEVLSPRGFRLSVPDQDDPGIVLLAVHAKLNEPFAGSEAGNIAGEAKPDEIGNWVYENSRTILSPGDTLYYWIYVQHKQLGYRLDNQKYIVPGGTTQSTRIPPKRPTRVSTSKPYLTTEAPTTHSTTTESRTCDPSITKVNGKSVCKGELIFEEDFSILDADKWKHQVMIPSDSEDAEFVSYQENGEICFVENGNLNIAPKLQVDMPGFTEERLRSGELNLGSRCTENRAAGNETCHRNALLFRILPPIVSCRLRTKDAFSFKYGKIEVRAKYPKGDWIFPQLYLEPVDNDYGSVAYASGQMRIGFIRSNEILTSKDFESIGGNRLCGGVILTPGEKLRNQWLTTSLQDHHLGNEYHTYSLTWTDEEIIMALDDVPYGTVKGGFKDSAIANNVEAAHQWSMEYMSPLDKEFYISIGVGVGGISDFPDGSRSGLQNLLKPWSNTSPKAELKFWNDRNKWQNTWNMSNYKLKVDHVKVWSI